MPQPTISAQDLGMISAGLLDELHLTMSPKIFGGNAAPTIADGTRTASLGNYTFPLVLKYVDEMKTVTEDDLRRIITASMTNW